MFGIVNLTKNTLAKEVMVSKKETITVLLQSRHDIQIPSKHYVHTHTFVMLSQMVL